jgi:hypothetical protein
MKIARGHILVISFCVLTFLFVAMRKAEKCLSVPEKYVCMFDARLSQEIKKQIRLFVESTDQAAFHEMNQFEVMIKQQFPFIRSIQTKLVPPATMKISCAVYEPCYVINNTHLIVADTSQVLLSPVDAYTQEVCDRLPRATVDILVFNLYTARELYALLSQIPNTIFEMYQIQITEHNTLILQDKKQLNLTLIARSGTDMAFLEKCGTYTRELLEGRKAFSGKSAVHYTADLRFEKHIILSKN